MSAKCGCVRNSFLFLSFLLATATCAPGQTPALVVDPVDNARRITLSGNVNPLARAEFDRGAADNSLPMNRILLLLKRSDDQEAALQSFMEQQQDRVPLTTTSGSPRNNLAHSTVPPIRISRP